MKKIKIGIVLLTSVMIAGLVLFSFGATAAKPVPQEIDKVVFVHYPQPQGNEAYWSPVKAPAPTDENTTYKYTGIHWSTAPVTWYDADGNEHMTPWPVAYAVNPTGGPEDAGATIETSFNTWEAAPGDMDFARLSADTSEISLDDASPDFSNVVSWENISTKYSGAIAVTVVWYLRGSKVIVEVDTIMNSAFPWLVNTGITYPDTQTGDSGYYDVQNIMAHEAGHWLMLGDLYQWNTQKLTMYGYGKLGELQKWTLGAGDELGIDRIY